MILHSLHRYPVKSMLGESLTTAEVTESGLTSDRAFALLDRTTGRIASAKYPYAWRELLTLKGNADGRITDLDGKPLDELALSRLLGRQVSLISRRPAGAVLQRAVPEQVLSDGTDTEVDATFHELGKAAPPGAFFDYAPVHLVTTATLDRVAELSPRGTVEAVRYRPNLVLDGADEPFGETAWAGRELLIGGRVRLRILLATPRCAVPTLAHAHLPRDPEALRVPARHNRVAPLPELGELPCLGAYAEVITPGRLTVGDAATLR